MRSALPAVAEVLGAALVSASAFTVNVPLGLLVSGGFLFVAGIVNGGRR